MDAATRERSRVFDDLAELYLHARPSYPAILLDDLIAAAGLRAQAPVLELGCGPGVASVDFASRGYRLLCLEPGARLCAIARRRLAGFAGCEVVTTTFEAWPARPGAFALVFAAQSFHWLDPQLRFSKAAQVLAAGGTLAVFANRALHGTSRAYQRMDAVYAQYAPELKSGSNLLGVFEAQFAAASEFEAALCREYPWRCDYTTAQYIDLLRTYSDHALLPQQRRTGLLEALARVIDDEGGSLTVDYLTELCCARRRDA